MEECFSLGRAGGSSTVLGGHNWRSTAWYSVMQYSCLVSNVADTAARSVRLEVRGEGVKNVKNAPIIKH